MKQLRTAAILVGVLAILGGVAYWEEAKVKKDAEAEKVKNKFSLFAAGDVQKIIFNNNSTDQKFSLTIEKSDDKWHTVAPVRGLADQTAVNALLNTLVEYKYESEINADKSRWADYGLDKPVREITLVSKDGKDETIFVGNKAPVGYSVYLRKSTGEQVYVGPQQILTASDKKISDFRDKSFIGYQEKDLIRAELRNKKGQLVFERSSTSEPYQLTTPAKFTGDSDAIADFLSGLTSEKAEEIIDQPSSALKAAFSPAKRLAQLSWTTKDGSKGELIFTEHDHKVYATTAAGERTFQVNSSVKTKLDKEANNFRDKTVLRFQPKDIAAVEIDGEGFTRIDNQWKRKDDPNGQNEGFVQNLLVDLEFAKTDSFPERKAYTSVIKAAPKHRIKLSFEPSLNRKDVTIDSWPDPNQTSMAYVKHSDSDQVYYVSTKVFNNVQRRDSADEADANPPLDLEDPLPQDD